MNANNLIQKYKLPLLACIICFLILVSYIVYQYFNKTEPINYESQQQAETMQGIKEAANNAKVKMLETQLNEAKSQIAKLKNKKPDKVVQTVIKEVPVVVEKEREKAKADFAIVTNPKEPNKPINLDDYNENDPVILNQYNVHAYKKVLRQIDYYPQSLDDWSPKELDFAISRKISKGGRYIGIATGYDFKQSKAKIGVRFTF